MTQRISVTTADLRQIRLYVSDCPSCGVIFGITTDMEDRRRNDAKTFYCPNGHSMSWSESKEDRLEKENAALKARRIAADDQARAAIRDAEAARVELLRTQHRIANGVCPCCTRSFENVRRHIAAQHPTFDPGPPLKIYVCSCGDKFDTFHGLRVHQGRKRDTDGDWAWDKPGQMKWAAHLTKVGAR